MTEVITVRNEQDCIKAANQAVWKLREAAKSDTGLVVPIRELLMRGLRLNTDELRGVGFSYGRAVVGSALYLGLFSDPNISLFEINPQKARAAKRACNEFLDTVENQPPLRLQTIASHVHYWNLMQNSWDDHGRPLDVLACVEFQR